MNYHGVIYLAPYEKNNKLQSLFIRYAPSIPMKNLAQNCESESELSLIANYPRKFCVQYIKPVKPNFGISRKWRNGTLNPQAVTGFCK